MKDEELEAIRRRHNSVMQHCGTNNHVGIAELDCGALLAEVDRLKMRSSLRADSWTNTLAALDEAKGEIERLRKGVRLAKEWLIVYHAWANGALQDDIVENYPMREVREAFKRWAEEGE